MPLHVGLYTRPRGPAPRSTSPLSLSPSLRTARLLGFLAAAPRSSYPTEPHPTAPLVNPATSTVDPLRRLPRPSPSRPIDHPSTRLRSASPQSMPASSHARSRLVWMRGPMKEDWLESSAPSLPDLEREPSRLASCPPVVRVAAQGESACGGWTHPPGSRLEWSVAGVDPRWRRRLG